MCTESSTAIGIRNMGIMELIMWIVKPHSTNNPMPHNTLIIATIMGEITKVSFRKIKNSSAKITIIAIGAVMPICTNISKPKVSSATGRPAR